MGIYEGLASIKAKQEADEARRAAAEASNINWLKIDDKETVRVWFLQELDKAATGYVEENGLGMLATEHTNPDNFRRRAVCSIDDEGRCVGCERHAADRKAGWYAKSRLYINVLVERKNGDREVAVMSQANGSKSVIAPMVIEYAIDKGTITDRWWKIKRTGTGNKTQYTPMPGDPSTDIDPADYSDEVFDVHKAVREVPYEEQFDHYFKTDDEDSGPKPPSSDEGSKSSGSLDEEW